MIVLTNHTDYLDVLEEYVDLEVLPPCISGDKGKGKAISGYFDKVSLDGGPIPKKKLEDIILRQKELCRQESTVSTLSDSGVGDSDDNSVDDNLTSTINVSTSVMMKGYFDMPVNVRDDVTVTTYPSSSDSALTVDF